MKIDEVIEYCRKAKEIMGEEEEIDVVFCMRNKEGKSRYISVNVCTVYTEDSMVSFSLEGPTVEIFRTEQINDL